MQWVREWWREYEPGLRHLSPNAAGALHAHIVEGTVAARLVGKRIGYEFPTEYARAYPWRATPYERLSYAEDYRERHMR
jgi:hypothetical protein